MFDLRPPRAADIKTLIDMGAALHAESVIKHVPYDRETVKRFVLRLIKEGGNQTLGIVAENNGELIGFFSAKITRYLWSRSRLAKNDFLYVTPTRRGSFAAVRMIHAAEDWARERGAKEMLFGTSSGIATKRTGEFVQHLGYQQVGGTYKLTLDIAAHNIPQPENNGS